VQGGGSSVGGACDRRLISGPDGVEIFDALRVAAPSPKPPLYAFGLLERRRRGAKPVASSRQYGFHIKLLSAR
jgi:hypothetical protein